MQKINAMFCAAKSTLDCQQAMLFVALVSGNAHLCLFVPNPVPHRIQLCTLVSPWSAHQFGTYSEAQPACHDGRLP
jgi:hypothetical protein